MDSALAADQPADVFENTEIGVTAARSLKRHAGDIIRAAEAGDPPVALLFDDLDDLIDEGINWRRIERMIAEWLGTEFEKAGRKPVPIALHRRGQCYRRIKCVMRLEPEVTG